MTVDFNFGATAEITLTPESPREESLGKMCYEISTTPYIMRNGDNKIRLIFDIPTVRKTTSTITTEDIRRSLGDQGAIIG